MTDIEKASGTSVLAALMADVAEALRHTPGTVFELPDVPVLTADDGDLDARIEAALGRLGLCATVMLSGLDDGKKSLPGPVFGSAELIIEVTEVSPVNRGVSGTGTGAIEAAEQAARALHQRKLGSGRLVWVADMRPYPQPPPPADVCWHIHVITGEVCLLPKQRN